MSTSADYAQSGVGGRGEGVGPSEPGTLGQMDSGEERYSDSGGYGSSFEDEPPLLQELGIDFQLIKQKVYTILLDLVCCIFCICIY